MRKFLVTLKTHADGPADELFVEVRATSPLAAAREASRSCRELGPFAVMRAVPWPRGVRCAEDAARKLAANLD